MGAFRARELPGESRLSDLAGSAARGAEEEGQVRGLTGVPRLGFRRMKMEEEEEEEEGSRYATLHYTTTAHIWRGTDSLFLFLFFPILISFRCSIACDLFQFALSDGVTHLEGEKIRICMGWNGTVWNGMQWRISFTSWMMMMMTMFVYI